MYVGAQEEQICDKKNISIVRDFLHVDSLKIPPNGDYPNQDANIAAAACKVNPANKSETIAAIAYESDEEYIKLLVIVFIDNVQGKVISSYRSEIGEDAATRIESGSLWLDTAAYNLAPTVRAFGLDVTSGYIPNCGDGGFGAVRTLYVQEGDKIRPISDEITMSYWRILKGDIGGHCGGDAANNLTQYVSLSIGVEQSKSNGLNDLKVYATSTVEKDSEREKESQKTAKSANKIVSHVVRYDGVKYSMQGWDSKLDGIWEK